MPDLPPSVHLPLKLFDPAYAAPVALAPPRKTHEAPDLLPSGQPRGFKYDDPVYQAARKEAIAREHGRCPSCLRTVPLEAHHRTVPYPPAGKTTADNLLALCRICHDIAHDVGFAVNVGVSPQVFRAAVSELVAILARPGDDGRRVGRAVWCEGTWGALVSGASRPSIGEAFWLWLRTKREWRAVAVTDVVDGRPGHWLVRKRFLDAGEERRPVWCRPGAASTDRFAA